MRIEASITTGEKSQAVCSISGFKYGGDFTETIELGSLPEDFNEAALLFLSAIHKCRQDYCVKIISELERELTKAKEVARNALKREAGWRASHD